MISQGDIIELGMFVSREGVPVAVKWFVVKTHGNMAHIIVKNYQCFRYPYSEFVPWKNSKLREWLNTNVFENIFSAEEKDCIIDTIVNDDERYFVTPGNEYEDPDIRSCDPIKVPPIITRDKLTIPQFREIAVKMSRPHEQYVSEAYCVTNEYKSLFSEIWGSNAAFLVLDLFQFNYKRRELVDDPVCHCQMNWHHDSETDDFLLGIDRLPGIGVIYKYEYVPVMAWIEIDKYNNLISR